MKKTLATQVTLIKYYEMANTFSKIYIHVVFSVKGRQSLIQKSWRNEFYKYICGIIKLKEQKVYAIGGIADHVHLLISVKPNILISDLVRDAKANSSRWINDQKYVAGRFQWQEGYGAFSIAESQLDQIIGYINSQEKHHGKRTFMEEYVDLLQLYKIDYTEKYLFDGVD